MFNFRRFLFVVFGLLLLVAAWVLTDHLEMVERLLAIFLTSGLGGFRWAATFEQFLTIVLVAALLAVIIIIIICLVALAVMRRAVARAESTQQAQETAVQNAIDQVKESVQQEYERLMTLSATLTQRLDKRALFHNILSATSQITSLQHADSVVGLWVVDFESDRLQFQMGTRCDERFFTQRQFTLSEQPFTRLLAVKHALHFERWEDGFPFVAKDKMSQLGSSNALILIPLVIERTILGCLVVFCHPDLLKTYEEQETFYNAAWGQLGLALAIAIQGELAILDRLTGAVNQAYFMKRLAQEIERCQRYKLPMGVLMIDIDNFKAVNDTLGHPQGDEVLKVVSRLIKQEVRVIDLVGRYGGEEFVVMMPETGLTEEVGISTESGSQAGVVLVADRIRKAVEDEFRDLQKPLTVTISIGVVVRRHPQEAKLDARDLIRVADTELYKAKTSGKNRCSVYVPEETEPVS